MQQFVVPQFIEVEDKIFGPVTTRQFLILLVSGLIVFLAYKYADFALFLFVLVFVGGSSLVFAFVKVNGQTFHYFVLNLIQSLRRPRLRIWSKNLSVDELNYLRNLKFEEFVKKDDKKINQAGRIRDLSLIVNTGGFYHPEE